MGKCEIFYVIFLQKTLDFFQDCALYGIFAKKKAGEKPLPDTVYCYLSARAKSFRNSSFVILSPYSESWKLSA